jgi:hypothetical protein
MASDNELRKALEDLLKELLAINKDHGEILDTDVREQMLDAVYNGFLKPKEHFVMPDRFGMFSDEGNQRVKAALESYIKRANQRAEEIGLSDPNERLAAFQDTEFLVGEGEDTIMFDDFFGWLESI